MDSVKAKFDKLANVHNATGDASFPPLVRMGKRIARDILGTAQAVSLIDRDSSSKNSDGEEGVSAQLSKKGESERTKRHSSNDTVGRNSRQRVGRMLVRKDKEEDDLVGYVGDISKAIFSSMKSNGSDSPPLQTVLPEIQQVVKEEVRTEVTQTNESIEDLKIY